MSNGHFIAFEGPDGTGKSTVVKRVISSLLNDGREVIQVREPGGTALGERCRNTLLISETDQQKAFDYRLNVLLEDEEMMVIASDLLSDIIPVKHPKDFKDKLRGYLTTSETPNGEIELVLFSISRHALLNEVVSPAITEGKMVLADRFSLSTFIYQGIGRKVSFDTISAVTQRATEGLEPSLIVCLDVPEYVAMTRIGVREHRDLFEQPEMWRLARQAYLDFAANYPDKIKVIDASGSPAQVESKVMKVICEELHITPPGKAQKL